MQPSPYIEQGAMRTSLRGAQQKPIQMRKSGQGSTTRERVGKRYRQRNVCRFLLFEVVAGTAVARIAAGEELVVLKRRADQ